MDLQKATFWGYKRENGRVGVRNHVVILPVDDLSNAAAQAVENNIKGTLALPHPYGRLQFGADLDLHFRTLIGTGANPNVAAVVVICIEDGWAKKVADGIAATGKPVAYFGIEQHGDHDTIMRASKQAKEYVQWASELRREERRLKDLWVSTTCGESDTTSGCGAFTPGNHGRAKMLVGWNRHCASGRSSSGRVLIQPLAVTGMLAMRPLPKSVHSRTDLVSRSKRSSLVSVTPRSAFHTMPIEGWSCRFRPTPGRSWTTSMPSSRSSSAGPMPESRRSWGVL